LFWAASLVAKPAFRRGKPGGDARHEPPPKIREYQDFFHPRDDDLTEAIRLDPDYEDPKEG
jgi:hypothetical protein